MRIYNTSVYREAINTDTVYMTPTDVMRAEVTEELNGIYELEFDMLVSDNAFRYVKVNNLVMTRVSNDADVAEQTFRIYEVNKSINGTATVRCQHISYDANRTVIGKFSVSNVSFPVLVATITNNIQNDNVMRFAAGSNYPTSTYSYSIEHPKTLRDIMGGEEGSLLDRFHVEFSYDNNVTYIWKTRGTDKGVRIEYGKNLVDFNETITGKNVDAVQGYYFNEDLWPNDPSRSILGSVINLTGATDPNVYLVDVTEALKDEGLANTIANIDAKARDYAARNSLDEAGVSLDASFIDLASTDEYRGQFKHQRIGLGDTVHIYVTNLGVEYSSRVKRSVYNVLTNNFDSLEIGEIEANLTDAIKDVQAGSVYMSTGSSIYYGYCTTAQGTAAKKVSIEGFPSVFSEGQKVSVKFQYANTASNPTLSINEGTAIAIKRYGTTAPGTSASASWNAGNVIELVYDGTYWQIAGWLNTTYSSMSVAEYESGTSETARLITPARLKAAILHHATPTNIGAVPSSDVSDTTSPFGKIPKIKSDGVIELGKYIDFHLTNGDTDYALRITASADGLTLSGQSLTGSSGKLMTDGDFADRVAEIGTSGNWAYRKWASGKTEAWRTVTVTASATTKVGSVYRSTATVDLPSGLFNSAPHLITSMDSVGSNLFQAQASATSATNINVRIWRANASNTEYNVETSFYCWKG